MSEEPEQTPEIAAPEQENRKPTLKARFKTIGMLCVFIAFLWVMIHYVIPKPFESIAPLGVNAEAVAPANQSPVEALSAEPIPNASTPPEDMMSSPAPEENIENSVDAANNEASDETAPTESETTLSAPSSIPEAEPAAPNQPSPEAQLMAAELNELSHSLLDKDQKISTLKCALQLQTSINQMDGLGMTLNQCYAVLVNAGVSQGDIRALTKASQKPSAGGKEVLLAAFRAAIAPALRVRDAEHVEESGWYLALRKRVLAAFIIRKTGWQEGENTEAIIGRAEFYLKQDRLDDAYDEIQKLADNAKKSFKDWLTMVDTQRTQQRVTEALIRASEAEKTEPRHGR